MVSTDQEGNQVLRVTGLSFTGEEKRRNVEPSVERYDVFYQRGTTLLEQQSWEAAAAAFRRAIELEPGFSWSHHSLGDALFKLERWEQAAAAYQRALELKPDISWSHHHLGNCLAKLECWAAAAAAYQQAIALDGDVASSYGHLGHALCKLDRWEEAAGAFGRATALDPADSGLHHALGDALAKLERWGHAVEAYRHAIELGPDVPWSYQNLGIALSKLELWEEAITAHQQAIAVDLDGTCWASSYDHLGIALSKLGRWEEAAAAFQRATALDPGSSRSHHCLGDALARLERWHDAVAAYRQAIALKPDVSSSHYHLGLALSKLERWEEAAGALGRATALNPADTWSHHALGDALAKLERWEGALAAYRRADVLNPEWSRADLGNDVARAEHWIEAALAAPAPSSSKPEARLLFVFDNDYGELTTAMYMLIGQELARQTTFLLPPRLYVTNQDSLPDRAGPYRTPDDVIRVVDAEKPDVVFLCSGYLFSIHGIFSLPTLERLVQLLDERGCHVVTSDPFLGLQSNLSRSTTISIDIPEHAPPVLKRFKEGADRKLTEHLSRSFQLLKDRIHVYPTYPAAPGEAPTKDVRGVSFFNSGLIYPHATGRAAARTLATHAGVEVSGKPKWVFVLASQDYELQLTFHGRAACIDDLVAMLEQTLRAGRHPVFIGPYDCVQGVIQRIAGTEAVTLMTFCPFKRFAALLLSAEYAFYWNAVSHSMLLRLFNKLPVFLFDRGHLARSVIPLYERSVDWYYQGWEPIYLDLGQELSVEGLAEPARQYREAAQEVSKHLRRAPPPDRMVERIRQNHPGDL